MVVSVIVNGWISSCDISRILMFVISMFGGKGYVSCVVSRMKRFDISSVVRCFLKLRMLFMCMLCMLFSVMFMMVMVSRFDLWVIVFDRLKVSSIVVSVLKFCRYLGIICCCSRLVSIYVVIVLVSVL